MMSDRWEVLLHDAAPIPEPIWSSTGHAMDWTTLDLFGVHPTRPGVRFDILSLLLLLQGGEALRYTSPGRWGRPSVGGCPM